MEFMKAMEAAQRDFFGAVDVMFGREPEEPYKAGYSTANRWFALKGLKMKLDEVAELMQAYEEDPEDSEEAYVAREYNWLLNRVLELREIVEEDMHDVEMDEDLERANNLE